MKAPQLTPGCCTPDEHRLHRRLFLKGLAASGVTAVASFNGLFTNPVFAEAARKAQKKVILLWLCGAPSQFETWDPKPGRPTGGPFQAIQTSVAGVRISELMPEMAKRLHQHTAIIRSLSTQSTDHTGPQAEAVLSGQRNDVGKLRVPSLGCMLARELSQPDSLLPPTLPLQIEVRRCMRWRIASRMAVALPG